VKFGCIVSLGTLLNRQRHLYYTIAQTCDGVKAQLVLSLGGSGSLDGPSSLPSSAVMVSFAPQRELLARAALTISHAGLNTTLESLSAGVPLVAMPITFEQPGIAARIRWTGVGESVSVSDSLRNICAGQSWGCSAIQATRLPRSG
jgi:UDP:flavonoid glycosyltransferase YjiC (YdhE family)